MCDDGTVSVHELLHQLCKCSHYCAHFSKRIPTFFLLFPATKSLILPHTLTQRPNCISIAASHWTFKGYAHNPIHVWQCKTVSRDCMEAFESHLRCKQWFHCFTLTLSKPVYVRVCTFTYVNASIVTLVDGALTRLPQHVSKLLPQPQTQPHWAYMRQLCDSS